MQRHDLDIAMSPARCRSFDRAADLRRARQKAQARCRWSPSGRPIAAVGDRLARRIGRPRSDACVPARRSPGSRRETPTPAPTSIVADMTTIRRDELRLSRSPIPCAPGLPRQRHREVGVDAAFVKLVEDDGVEIGEQRIGLQAAPSARLRSLPAAGSSRAEAALEADLPADLVAERPAALVGDTCGHGARGHAARLQQNHRAVGEQRRRNASGFAGARRGGDDRRARASTGRSSDDRSDRMQPEDPRSRKGEARAIAISQRLRSRRDPDRAADAGSADDRSSRPGSSPGTAGDNPRRSRTPARERFQW